MLVKSYLYYYGAGTEPNRRVEFYRPDPSSLEARVDALRNGQWIQTSVLKPGEIEVELATVEMRIEQVKERYIEKSKKEYESPRMSEYTVDKQDEILNNLEPNGPYRLEIENAPGGPEGLEKVVSIQIFNSQ